jgi:PAS domain S-box-containing protein
VEDYAIFTTDAKGIIKSWNTGAEKIFGWTAAEITGKSAEIVFTPEDRQKRVPQNEMQTALQEGCAEDERFHIRKDGTRFYASGILSPLKDSRLKGFVKVARDMTAQIAAANATREKEMLQKLVKAQEDERKRIARDLHDELGQQLTGLRLKIVNAENLCRDKAVADELKKIQSIAEQIDQGVDFLAWELRPAALDDLGLFAALEKYVREWSHYSGVTAEFLTSNIEKVRFAPEAETNLYRIAQEALNNVHKHAAAKTVEIALKKRDNLIVLIIEDDGRGFDPQDNKNREKGIGLIGMQERALLLGGEFEIESAPGRGTSVFVRVPALLTQEKADEE